MRNRIERLPHLLLVLLAVLALGACEGSGKLAPTGPFPAPEQTELSYFKPLGVFGDYDIWAMDEFEIEGMILSRKRYRFDKESKLSPVDFLIAWGPLTQEPAVSQIEWSQSGRWGFFRYPAGLGLSPQTITRNHSNMHVVPDPSDRYIRRQVLRVRRGDVVRMRGYLVQIDGPDGWRWRSSRSRTDTGARACEIMFVTDIEVR